MSGYRFSVPKDLVNAGSEANKGELRLRDLALFSEDFSCLLCQGNVASGVLCLALVNVDVGIAVLNKSSVPRESAAFADPQAGIDQKASHSPAGFLESFP